MKAARPDPSCRPTAIRLAVYTLVLFASWNLNVLGVPTGVTWYRGEPRTAYYGFDAFLVLNRLRAADAVPPAYPMVFEFAEAGEPVPYRSQFGGQGIALAVLQQALGVIPAAFAPYLPVGAGLLAAFAFASVFAVAGRRFGPLAGDIAVVLAAPAPVMLQLAPSAYWLLGLVLGPFALVWAYGRCAVDSPPGWAGTLAAVGLMAFAKCLCGYEFVTTMLAAPVAALWYHQHTAGLPLRKRWQAAGALVAVGVAGFALAVGCHAAQLKYVLNDDPLAVIGERALTRTVTTETGVERWGFDRELFPVLPERLRFPVNCFIAYFRQPVAGTPLGWGEWHRELPLRALVLVLLVAGGVAACVPVGKALGGLIGAAALALLAGASWQVLAANHMCAHPHMNLIVYHLGFVPLALVLVGCAAATVAERLRVAGLVPWVLAALVIGSAGYAIVTAKQTADADTLADRAATERVAALAARGERPWDTRVAVSVDRFGTQRLLHANTVAEAGWVPLGTADDRAPVLLLTGWATDLPPARPYRAPRLVVTVDGKPVPAFVARNGLPVLDRRVGWEAPTAAFVVVVPRRLAPDPAKVQVYAVSATDPAAVTAARMPAFTP